MTMRNVHMPCGGRAGWAAACHGAREVVVNTANSLTKSFSTGPTPPHPQIGLLFQVVMSGKTDYADYKELHWASAFYRTGSVIFGGGQVTGPAGGLSEPRGCCACGSNGRGLRPPSESQCCCPAGAPQTPTAVPPRLGAFPTGMAPALPPSLEQPPPPQPPSHAIPVLDFNLHPLWGCAARSPRCIEGLKPKGTTLERSKKRLGIGVFLLVQVVLPMLFNDVVSLDCTGVEEGQTCPEAADSWMSQDQFYAGLALAQAMPGPLFNFAAYLGESPGVAPLTPSRSCLGSGVFWSRRVRVRFGVFYVLDLESFGVAASGSPWVLPVDSTVGRTPWHLPAVHLHMHAWTRPHELHTWRALCLCSRWQSRWHSGAAPQWNSSPAHPAALNSITP
jgi:hypothetical protein